MTSSDSSSLAFVFPGQGSQAVGMLNDFADEPVVKDAFAVASDALSLDLWHLVTQGPEDTLNSTQNTQPALLTASVALWRLWCARGGVCPAAMAGHSLGEYSALVAAGVLDLASAVCLVKRRGELMQLVVPEGQGAMAVILGLEDDRVRACCLEAEKGSTMTVSPANFNAPGQVVIAGNRQMVDVAIGLCSKAGAKRALSLPISVPSHCALMQPMTQEFAEELENHVWSEPQVTVIHNIDAKPGNSIEKIKQKLLAQLQHPVLWVDCVQSLKALGIQSMLECGPGNVLTGLNKRIDRSLVLYSLEKNLTEALGLGAGHDG